MQYILTARDIHYIFNFLRLSLSRRSRYITYIVSTILHFCPNVRQIVESANNVLFISIREYYLKKI